MTGLHYTDYSLSKVCPCRQFVRVVESGHYGYSKTLEGDALTIRSFLVHDPCIYQAKPPLSDVYVVAFRLYNNDIFIHRNGINHYV